MFTTGIEAAARRRRRSPPSPRGPTASPQGGTAGHHRADLRGRLVPPAGRRQHLHPRRQRLVDGSDRGRRSRPPPARPAEASLWPIVGGVGAVLVVVGLVTYPVVFMFGIVVLLGRGGRVDGPGVERAGLGRRRVQRRDARARRQPGWSSRCWPRVGARGPRLLVQPDHAVALEDERSGRCSASSPRSCSAAASCSPSGRDSTVASCAASARSALVGARRQRRRGRASPAQRAHPERGDHGDARRRRGECATPDETEADENASQIGRRQGERRWPRSRCNADGTLTAHAARAAPRRPHRPADDPPLGAVQHAVPQRQRRRRDGSCSTWAPARRATTTPQVDAEPGVHAA